MWCELCIAAARDAHRLNELERRKAEMKPCRVCGWPTEAGRRRTMCTVCWDMLEAVGQQPGLCAAHKEYESLTQEILRVKRGDVDGQTLR